MNEPEEKPSQKKWTTYEVGELISLILGVVIVLFVIYVLQHP